MSRQKAIARATDYFDGGAFATDLARRVGLPTESRNPQRAEDIKAYLRDEMEPFLKGMGFSVSIESRDGVPPFLIAERFERADATTVLGYGHGDVVDGMDKAWQQGLSPWTMTEQTASSMGAARPITRVSTRSILRR